VEGLLTLHERQHALQAPAGLGLLAGVHQRDTPRLGRALVHLHAVVGDIKGDVGDVQEVVGEVLLDQVTLVAQADHELVDSVGRVDLHDVPEDRLAADLHHWLGLQGGFLAEA
jgi:hypothetical protein